MVSAGGAIPDLATRNRQAEVMDDPSLDPSRHREALRSLARINRLSLAGARVWREVADLGPACGGRVRVLDLGCGGGDVLMDVARRARRVGAEVELHGCDVSPVALEHARASCGQDPAVDFFHLDALTADLPEGYDLITCCLFLHHLACAEAAALLRRAGEAAGKALLVQDLRRSYRGYALAWLASRALTRSPVVRVDALRSVRAAFTEEEIRELCDRAGLSDATIHRHWPQRLVVRWRKRRRR